MSPQPSPTPSAPSYAYRRSYGWLALALLRGACLALLCLGPLLAVGRRSVAPDAPWTYALWVGVPLGLIAAFPSVGVEQWAAQRRVVWWVALLLASLSMFGSWILGLLVGNSLYQFALGGLPAISQWLRERFAQLSQQPMLWFGLLGPPVLFGVAATFRYTLQQRGKLLVGGLTVASFVAFLLARHWLPGSPLQLALFFLPMVAFLLVLHRISDALLDLLWPQHDVWPPEHPSCAPPLPERPALWEVLLLGGRDLLGFGQLYSVLLYVGVVLFQLPLLSPTLALLLLCHGMLTLTAPYLAFGAGLWRRTTRLCRYRLSSPWHLPGVRRSLRILEARSLLAQGKLQQAHALLPPLLRHFPSSALGQGEWLQLAYQFQAANDNATALTLANAAPLSAWKPSIRVHRLLLLAAIHIAAESPSRAFAALHHLDPKTIARPRTRAIFLNHLACCAFLTGRSLDEYAAWAEEAYRLAPALIGVRATWGAILVLRNESLDRATEHLKASLHHRQSSLHDRAWALYFLGLWAEHHELFDQATLYYHQAAELQAPCLSTLALDAYQRLDALPPKR